MKNIKKWILTVLCAVCAGAIGVATTQLNKDVETASAAVATDYTIVDTPMMMKISDVYAKNGNFNLQIVMPQIDTEVKQDGINFDGKVDLPTVFNQLNFFDNVKIGNKTLKELGCTGFWENKLSVNVNEPNFVIRLHCHADKTLWNEAIANGEVVFGNEAGTAVDLPVTVAEGTLVPGYSYLMGEANATVYRADREYVTRRHQGISYSYALSGITEVESVSYVQGHDGANGYIGVSLKGVDYTVVDNNVEIGGYQENIKAIGYGYGSNVLVNGEAGKVAYYGLYNLGAKGQNYFSFVIYPTAEETQSITIPAGTKFPVELTLINDWASKNVVEGKPRTITYVYETKTTKVFEVNEEGVFESFEGYPEEKTAELNELRASKVDANYFSADVEAMNAAVEAAVTKIASATTRKEVNAAFNEAKAVLDSCEEKTAVIANAKNTLDTYKSGAFREAEETERKAIVSAAKTNLDNAASKAILESIVINAKDQIDLLKTAAQYADEELAPVKKVASTEISSLYTTEGYYEEQVAELEAVVEAGLLAVKAATTESEITKAMMDAKKAAGNVITKAQYVESVMPELNGYKAEEGLYREAQATERANVINAAKGAMMDATSVKAIGEIIADAKATIDTLKTDAELTAEEKVVADALLAERKITAREEVNVLKANVVFEYYNAENRTKINELYRVAQKTIAEAASEEEITAAIAAFKAGVEALPKTENPDADTQEDATQDSEVKEENAKDKLMAKIGCSSVVGVSGIVGVLCVMGVAALACKKKED